MSVLDDLKMVHDRDKQDALGVAENQWQQLLCTFDLPKIEGEFSNIVYAGMGGSALSANLAQTWPTLPKPFEICRTYDIPSYVNKNTLFIAVSYSGTTEETLSALAQAEERNAKIVIITSGGKLAEIANQKGYPICLLPEISQPRYATLAILKALVEVLVAAGLCDESKKTDLENLANKLEKDLKKWRVDVPVEQNSAKKLAQDLVGSSVVVYSSVLFMGVAYKWKIGINENAKNVSWYGVYPEFNHNEFLGWSSHPIDKPYKIVNLLSSFDHSQIKKRFEISERMLSGKKPAAESIELQGDSVLEQMIYGTTFGDFVSLYLALLNGLNPSPVDLITKLKAELA